MSQFPDRLYPEMPEADRRRVIMDSCDEILENQRFPRALSEVEIQNRKDSLAERAIKINDIEAEKKRAAAQYDAQLKPLKVEQAVILHEIKNRSIDAIEPIYVFRDFENGYGYRYDQRGHLISRTILSPQEMQATTMQVIRNNDQRHAIGE